MLLTGCASLPVAPPPDAEAQQRLESLEQWSLSGRVAVSDGREGFSAALDWRQDGERAEIGLRGPLGSGALRIGIDGGHLSLDDGHGQVLSGGEARAVLAQRLGVDLPVGQLRYWIRGLPAPGGVPQLERGPAGEILGLSQDGWRLRYSNHQDAGELRLPGRVELAAGEVRVRMVIRDWRLGP